MAVKPALRRRCRKPVTGSFSAYDGIRKPTPVAFLHTIAYRKPAPAAFLQRIISIVGTVMHPLVPAANEKKEENLCKALQ